MKSEDVVELERISHSRTEPLHRVERAIILLELHKNPCISAVSRELQLCKGVVANCYHRLEEFGLPKALEDRHRAGRHRTITDADRAWVVSLACCKPKDIPGAEDYPHELWTIELLSQHVRKVCVQEGHSSLQRSQHSTISRILSAAKVHQSRIRYFLEKRDDRFEEKKRESAQAVSLGEIAPNALAHPRSAQTQSA